MPITSPIRLSDAQMDAVLAASFPLLPNRRSAFLEACARELANLPEGIGDGSVHRVVTVVQRKYFDPPQFESGDHAPTKYSRVIKRAGRGRPRLDDDVVAERPRRRWPGFLRSQRCAPSSDIQT
jgi:hypothetical protein